MWQTYIWSVSFEKHQSLRLSSLIWQSNYQWVLYYCIHFSYLLTSTYKCNKGEQIVLSACSVQVFVCAWRELLYKGEGLKVMLNWEEWKSFTSGRLCNVQKDTIHWWKWLGEAVFEVHLSSSLSNTYDKQWVDVLLVGATLNMGSIRTLLFI